MRNGEITQEQLKEKLRELDRRMMQLPIGKADAEHNILEVEHNRLRKILYSGHYGRY